jgi:hypothetical protein
VTPERQDTELGTSRHSTAPSTAPHAMIPGASRDAERLLRLDYPTRVTGMFLAA